MTVNVSPNRANYIGNGVTTVFPYPYKFLTDASLVVELSYRSTGLPLIPQPVLNVDYTVTGAGSQAGGAVTFIFAPTTAFNLVIFGNPPVEQPTSLPDLGQFPASSVETALDNIVLIQQRFEDRIDRALEISDEVVTFNNNKIQPQSNFLLAFDNLAQNVVAVDPTSIANAQFVYASVFKVDYIANAGGQYSFIPGVTTQLVLPQDPIIADNTIVAWDNSYINKSNYSITGNVITFNMPIPNGFNIVEINMNAVVLGMNAPGAGTVTNAALQSGIVTVDKIAPLTITGAQIQDASIPLTKLIPGTAPTLPVSEGGTGVTTVADIRARYGAYPGQVAMFAKNAVPQGWLVMNGALHNIIDWPELFAVISNYYGGDALTTFAVPNDAGYFHRAWDYTGAVDPARNFGSLQVDDFKSHDHAISGSGTAGVSSARVATSAGTQQNTPDTNFTGGTETRPKNIAFYSCIFAGIPG